MELIVLNCGDSVVVKFVREASGWREDRGGKSQKLFCIDYVVEHSEPYEFWSIRGSPLFWHCSFRRNNLKAAAIC